MKYVINILAAAILLAACTKTEVTYDSPSEIAFAPAAAVMTKAEAGYVGGQLNVFAYTKEEDVPYIPYFANAAFTDTDKNGIYDGVPTQYWPNTNSLWFAGYTGDTETNVNCNYIEATSEKEESVELIISGYNQDGDNDLMWFFTEEIEAKGDVEPILYHACAKITIKVEGEKKEGQDEGPCDDWLIKNVDIANLYTSGKVTFTSGSANPTWTLSSTSPTTDTQLSFTAGATIGSKPSVSTIVIPQPPTTLSVTYNDKTVGDISLDYNSGAAWQAGYHYTYTLNFKNPYKIEFSVSKVDPWGEGGIITMQ